jgi:hypothetical protein
MTKRGPGHVPQGDRQRHGFAGREVDRRQRPLLVEAVAAGPPGFGPHRHAGLLERADVALDRPGADLEPVGQPPGAARPRRDRPQFLDKGI